MQRCARTLQRRASLVRFGVVGLINTVLVYAAFSLLMRHHMHSAVACCGSWCCGLASSYVLNRLYAFRARGRIARREVATFILGYVLQLGLGILVYALLIDRLGMRYPVAFAINLVLASAFSYTFMDRLVFRAAPQAHP